MTTVTNAAPGERAPQQSRSRESWDRVMQVGMELFAERGWQGLTIAEVCRRAGVTPPSIYARVDGKAGLFRAVHERWLEQIRETEAAQRREHVVEGASTADAAANAARVVIGVFDAHPAALRALIDRSAHDPELLARGGAASRHMLADIAGTIPGRGGAAVVRAVYAECLLRLVYGPRFLEPLDETDGQFRDRVVGLAQKLASA